VGEGDDNAGDAANPESYWSAIYGLIVVTGNALSGREFKALWGLCNPGLVIQRYSS
jgi:hypothetical protein